jgi:FMN phosphatase YigB (HAD superfamily)
MSPRVVAFDLGGVVVDVDHGVLAELGDATLVESALFGEGRHDALTNGELDADAFIAAAADVLGVDPGSVADRWRRVVRFSDGGLALVQMVARTVPVAVWSNTDALHWQVLGSSLEKVASSVAPSFRLRCQKPDPMFFIRALESLEVEPHQVLFLDDRADNVAAARALGIDAVVCRGVEAARSIVAERRLLTET